MGKTISEIYTEYKIMRNLQMHMFRVAAVAYIICDNMAEPVSKEDVVTACLLHDMGNIIKFKFDVPEFLQPEGLEYWQSIKDEYMAKYGNDTHQANIKIIRELGMSERIIFLADQVKFSLLCTHKGISDIDVKVTHYSDGRVDPYGVVSYQARHDEAAKRYGNRLGSEEERDRLVACGIEIEKQIFAKCEIRPKDITDEVVAPIIEELRSFVIK